jgi:hypothetical protein
VRSSRVSLLVFLVFLKKKTFLSLIMTLFLAGGTETNKRGENNKYILERFIYIHYKYRG